MKHIYHLFFAAISAMLFFACVAAADSVDFSQLSYDVDGTIFSDTEWGAADVTFTGQSDLCYFNLNVNGSWQVQNMAMPSIQGVGADQILRFCFDLGSPRGTNVSSINYGYTITSSVLQDMPAMTGTAAVGDTFIDHYDCVEEQTPALPAAEPVEGGEAKDPKPHTLTDFPVDELKCGKNECVPAAIHASLVYLNKKDKLELTDDQMSIETWKKALKMKDGEGAGRFWDNLKDEYLLKNKIPVKTVGWSRRGLLNENYLKRFLAQFDDKQDIEIAVDRVHVGVLVSITPLKDGKFELGIADSDQKGAKGKATTTMYTMDPNPEDPKKAYQLSGSGELEGKEVSGFTVECPRKPTKANEPTGPTTGGDKKDENGSPAHISYSAETQTLSFESTIMGFANRAGNESLDPAFANDPLMGAVMSISDMVLYGSTDEGWDFADGKLTITKDGVELAFADIPSLLISDSAAATYGANIFGTLEFTDAINDDASPFLAEFDQFITDNFERMPAELFGSTDIPIGDFIANGQDFDTTVTYMKMSSCAPEPATICLLAFGLALIRKRK